MFKLLIAEDEESIRALLGLTLRKRGYEVEFAADGAVALEKARLAPPDLIVSDLMMPEMDGYMLCRKLKQNERLRKIPFILYTATNSEKDEAKLAKDVGAARFVPKLGELKFLLDAIEEELAKNTAGPEAASAAEPDPTELDKDYLRVLLRKLRVRERELEQARSGLQKSEERLKKAQAMARVGGWELDLRTNVILASEEAFRIYGLAYSAAGISLDAARKAVLPEYRQHMSLALKRLISTQGVYDEEFLITRAGTAEIRHIHSKAELVCDPAGLPLKVEGVMQDITEHKLAQEALRQAQKLDSIGRLSGGIAHDLNNLLGPILGYADFLGKSLKPDDQRLADVEEIVKAADRAAGLVRKLLAFSRRQVLEPRVVSLNEIISDMGRMLQRVIGEDRTLRLDPGAAADHVKVDPGQIEQVLLNLTLNARDAMENGGEIVIGTSDIEVTKAAPSVGGTLAPGRYIVLSVRDCGCGMDEATKARIFEPFFTTKSPDKGTGLGLPSVYGIVKQSGGELQVESAPGRGSIFSIYFPPAKEAPVSARGAGTPAAKAAGEVVLIVEDDETMRRITRRILADSGYSVLEAVNGLEALKALANQAGKIDLLLTDLVMPGMDGIKLSLEVISKYPATKILCMSGYADKETEMGAVLGKKAGFIQKPFSMDALARKVRDTLDQVK